LKINDFVECPAYRKFVLSILLLRCWCSFEEKLICNVIVDQTEWA
jgi:hypothetical protein